MKTLIVLLVQVGTGVRFRLKILYKRSSALTTTKFSVACRDPEKQIQSAVPLDHVKHPTVYHRIVLHPVPPFLSLAPPSKWWRGRNAVRL